MDAFQFAPATETKLVRCTRGAILDVIVDVRPESPTYLNHVAVELSADNHRAFYVPARFAHGYQVLEDVTETSYQVGEFYPPYGVRAARDGVRAWERGGVGMAFGPLSLMIWGVLPPVSSGAPDR